MDVHSGAPLNLLSTDRPKPWRSIGSGDCSHVQSWSGKVRVYCEELDPEVCDGLTFFNMRNLMHFSEIPTVLPRILMSYSTFKTQQEPNWIWAYCKWSGGWSTSSLQWALEILLPFCIWVTKCEAEWVNRPSIVLSVFSCFLNKYILLLAVNA